MKKTGLFLAVLGTLAGCSSFPRAEFSVSAFGVTLAADTRSMTNDVGNVAATMIRATGITPPVVDTSADPQTARDPAPKK